MAPAHSKLSPSSSKRWLTCQASVGFLDALRKTKKIPKDDSSVFSDEGTTAHDYCSNVLEGKLALKQVPESFRPHVAEWVSICHALECEFGHGKPIIEGKVPLFYFPQDHGTVDFATWGAGGLHIRDFKYGVGVYVDAVENTQLAIYAQSLIKWLEDQLVFFEPETPVTIGIHQPRFRGEEKLRVWETTVGELEVFCAGIKETAEHIMKTHWQELPFAPSVDACQFCPAKKAKVCEAREKEMFSAFPVSPRDPGFSLDDLLPVSMLSDVDKVTIFKNSGMIKAFLKEIEADVNLAAAAGEMPEGLKFIRGRKGNYRWTDEGEAAELLKRLTVEPWNKKLISPAKAREEISAKAVELGYSKDAAKGIFATLDKILDRPEGKIKLAPVESKSPEVEIDAARKYFSVVTDDDEEDNG